MADPIWLPEVLKAAGLKVQTHQPHDRCGGYLQNGHGDFGEIWGVMFHHTGSYGETENGIAHHPSLGLCSQALVLPDGTWVICGVGIAYHGGAGGGIPGLWDPNEQMIGVEVASDGGGSAEKAAKLPHHAAFNDKQYNSVVVGFAAILKKLGKPPARAIAHKEWAGAAQGKWDPGTVNMNTFRNDVANAMDGNPIGGDTMWSETFKNFKNGTVSYGLVMFWLDKLANLTHEQLTGVDGKGWKILGRSKINPDRDNTVVEAVAELRNDVAEIKELLKKQ